jgi:hypothetical protein
MLDQYQSYIHKSRYARWTPALKRREHWEETVDRYITFMTNHVAGLNDTSALSLADHDDIQKMIMNHKVMPSMRAMMTAGKALERDNVCGYNCAYVAVDDIKAFDEAMFILMCGTGIGFSVERQYINKLPEIPDQIFESDTTIIVKDSKEGWGKALRMLISLLYAGECPEWNLSKVREAGAILKTFGGRSSGPGPLDELFKFVVFTFRNAQGRRLTSLECHDIMCKIGEVVVVGGVRRSAMISLSNLSDDRMRHAKSGEWWHQYAHRALSNNSAVYTEKPEVGQFMEEWLSLYASKSGERGFFSRDASKRVAEANGRRDPNHDFGTNPCSEIILRPNQFCVSGSTPLITKNGIFNIETLENQEIQVWNSKKWSNVTVRKTQKNQEIYRVYLSDGSYLDCTKNHKWSVKDRFKSFYSQVETKDLLTTSKYTIHAEPTVILYNDENKKELQNAYTLGFAYGDGFTKNNSSISITLYGDKIECPIVGTRKAIRRKKKYNVLSQDVLCKDLNIQYFKDLRSGVKSFRTLTEYNRDSILNFVAGLADADGSKASKGIRIYISNETKAKDLQLILTNIGINSSVNLQQKKGAKTNYGKRKDDIWYLQITKTNEIPCKRLICNNTELNKFKGKHQTITRVEKLSKNEDTYCFHEPEENKAVFNNVLTYQCNLTEVVARHDDT